MKRLFNILLSVAFISIAGTSCTNLDEELFSIISQDNYGTTSEEMNSLIGPAYGTMVNLVNGYFWYGMTAGDDYIIPSRGYDWNSGGIYRHTHEHLFSATEANDVYNFWHFGEVTTINKTLKMIDETTVEIANKDRVYAELRGLRAWWYFYMMDKIGAIPIVTTFDESIPTNKGITRIDVYNFIKSELEEIIPALSEDVNITTYAKFTKWVGYTLLAKLKLNAEVYTGTADYEGALAALNAVIDSEKYILEPDNNTNFLVKNEKSRENIFVIPYDYEYFRCYFIPYQMSWHYNVQEKMGVVDGCWNGPCFTPSFMNSYDSEDLRLGWFMYGQQYAEDGVTKLKDRNGNDLNITFEMADYANATEVEGARILKWEVEKGGHNHLNNDFAVFRYVDVLLMKAECLLRGGDVEGATKIVNDCRKRNFADYTGKEIDALTLDELLAERGRELVVEGWRRNDLIRFGKFMGTFDFKNTNDDPDGHTLLFPIPQGVIDNNKEIIQNPGY